MAKTSPGQFIQQTRAEIAKIVWPTRREVFVTTWMVFLLAAFLAVFFSLTDVVIREVLDMVLRFFAG